MWFKKLLSNCFSMAFNRFKCDHKPIVVVLGATGTGKSKLALEIAKKFNGEVISADSMQVYKGLDIITNKVTAEERQEAPHHLLDFVDPLQDFHIQQFRDLAVSTIDDLHRESKLPVVVGGTHYYIESVLWKVLVTGAKNSATTSSLPQTPFSFSNILSREDNSLNSSQTSSSIGLTKTNHIANVSCQDPSKASERDGLSKAEAVAMDAMSVASSEAGEPQNMITREIPDATEDLYERLITIDPDRASMLHPKDRRKIIRSLQVWEQTGEMHSVHIQRQQEEAGGNVLGGGLRYPNTVVFWLNSDQTVLDARLNGRVDVMLQSGLLNELLDFHEHYNKTRLRHAASSVDAAETNNSIKEENRLKDSKSSSSGTEKTVQLSGGQKHTASFEENTSNKRLKLDPDCMGSPVSETLLKSTEEATESASSPEIINKHRNDTGDDDKQAHRGSVPSTQLQPLQADYSQGIFQSIGFKEFHEYLVLPPEEKNSDQGEKLRQNGIDLMKLATRRYARRQVKWIRNRFTKDLERPVPPIYRLDVTEPSDWEAAVSVPADAVVDALMAGHPPPDHVIKPLEKIPAPLSEIQGRFERHECTLCKRVFIGREQWRAHIRGAKHKKMKQKAATLLQEQLAPSEGGEECQSKSEKDVEPLEKTKQDVTTSKVTAVRQ